MSATGDWAGTLSAFARHLDMVEEVASGGRWREVRPFRVPPGLGPLPVGLRAEAARLLTRNRAVEDALERALERTREELLTLTRRSTPAERSPSGPAYVDSRA
ncbi:MAG: hypothetical protein ACM31K_01450 [Solirubrobacterales bacterium]